VWSDFERAKIAVATEASALRAAHLLAAGLPTEQQGPLRSPIAQHVDEAVNHEWPEMARQRASLSGLPAALIETLQRTLAVTPASECKERPNAKSQPRWKPLWKLDASASLSVNQRLAPLNGLDYCFRHFAR
jgi:hypothetical protein